MPPAHPVGGWDGHRAGIEPEKQPVQRGIFLLVALKKHFEIQALHDHAVHFGHDDFFLCLDIFINAKKLILGRRRDFLFD